MQLFRTTVSLAGATLALATALAFAPTLPAGAQSYDSGTDAANPSQNLTLGSDGLLYGVAPFGGAAGEGVLFSFDPHGDGNPVILHTFTGGDGTAGSDGGNPNSPLIEDENGNYFGTTAGGGTGQGTIYAYTADGHFLTLFDFSRNSTDASHPNGPLVEYAPGHFAGASTLGGTGAARTGSGTVYTFEVKTHPAPKPITISNIVYYDLAKQITGQYPDGGLTLGPSGMVYGTTYVGGANDLGTVFSFDPSDGVFRTLHDFYSSEGSGPLGSLLYANGTLYGTTSDENGSNGSDNAGTVFTCSLTGQFQTIYKFDGADNGGDPEGSLAFGPNGDLYVTAPNDGKYESGSILEFTGDGSPNHHFSFDKNNPNDGTGPLAGLCLGDDGIFYGVTEGGGKYGVTEGGYKYGFGTIYSLDPATLSHTILHSFGKPLGS